MDNFPHSLQTIVRTGGFFMRKKWLMLLLPILMLLSTNTVYANPSYDIKSIDLQLGDGEVAITFLNLPDGEATLIQNEDNSILINTGGRESKSELKKLLGIYNVKNLHTIFLTNDGQSYIGNLSWLVDKYHVKNIISSETIQTKLCQSTDENASYCFLMEKLDKKKDEILPGLKVKLLSEAVDGRLNLLLSFGQHHVVYLGYDDEKKEEQLSEQELPQATILKVSNFGEEPSINSNFLTKIDPQMAVIFHRKNHSPSENVLSKLQMEWMDLYQTSQIGCVTVKMSAKSYDVFTFLPKENKPNRFTHLLHFIYKMITMEL